MTITQNIQIYETEPAPSELAPGQVWTANDGHGRFLPHSHFIREVRPTGTYMRVIFDTDWKGNPVGIEYSSDIGNFLKHHNYSHMEKLP